MLWQRPSSSFECLETCSNSEPIYIDDFADYTASLTNPQKCINKPRMENLNWIDLLFNNQECTAIDSVNRLRCGTFNRKSPFLVINHCRAFPMSMKNLLKPSCKANWKQVLAMLTFITFICSHVLGKQVNYDLPPGRVPR